jgi:hypothetical protein
MEPLGLRPQLGSHRSAVLAVASARAVKLTISLLYRRPPVKGKSAVICKPCKLEIIQNSPPLSVKSNPQKWLQTGDNGCAGI